jgi:methylated-DNA-protein-cysteine methyltransferase-like protein
MARAKTQSFHALFRPLAAKGSRAPSSSEDSLQAIWNVVARIPRGQVSSYGDVARAAGLPGRARLAGKALRLMPEDMNLPWHRVMGAGGRIVFPKGSRHFREQARLLRSEGVTVKDGRVDKSALSDLDEF